MLTNVNKIVLQKSWKKNNKNSREFQMQIAKKGKKVKIWVLRFSLSFVHWVSDVQRVTWMRVEGGEEGKDSRN